MSVSLTPVVKFRWFNTNGAPLSGGKVYTYVSGSSTPCTTYSDAAGTVSNTNPVILDSAGYAPIYLTDGQAYRFVIKTSADVTLQTIDSVYGSGSGAAPTSGPVNVLDYGATGDGVTNDTAAFLDAMAACDGQVVYVPAGTYVVSAQLNNSAGRVGCMGFIGDSSTTSIIDMSSITTHGMVFNNPPVGMRFENFRLMGPGQSAPVTARGLSLPVDGTGETIISFQCNFVNVSVEGWPTAGFYWQLPIVSTYTNCVAQMCGDYGFHIDIFEAEYVGGTSTQFNACYANNVLGYGYYIKSHGYSVLSSCASDNCNIGYYIKNGFGQMLSGCGYEVGTYIDAARPAYMMVFDGASGCAVDSCWSYNMPHVDSAQIKIIESNGLSFRNMSGYQDNLVAPTYNATIDAGTTNILFENCIPTSSDSGPISSTYLVNDPNNVSLQIYGNTIKNLAFETPDVYGNTLYVRNGALVISADPGFGALSLFQTLLFDFPVMSFDNTGTIAIGNGTGVADTFISRAGVNSLLLSPIKDGISIIGNNTNPAVFVQNTGTIPGHWSFGADNDGGFAFYDQEHDAGPMYVWPTGGTAAITDGTVQFNRGIRVVAGAKVHISDETNSAAGSVVFAAATTAVVTNTAVTANSRIFATIQQVYSGAASAVYVSSITPGVGFTLGAAAALDASVSYFIVEPD